MSVRNQNLKTILKAYAVDHIKSVDAQNHLKDIISYKKM